MNTFFYLANVKVILLLIYFRGADTNLAKFPLKSGRSIGRPLDCQRVDDCEDRPQEPQEENQRICGSNGVTFKSFCPFLRAYCEENVKFKSFGDCSVSDKCLGEREKGLKDAETTSGVYIPECLKDGSYRPVQCHSGTNYCWCATPSGNVIRESITVSQAPNCNNFTKRSPTNISVNRSPVLFKGGCEGKKRVTFINNVQKSIVNEYLRENNKLSVSDISLEIASLEWKFKELNRKNDGELRRSEYRGMQKVIRKSFRPKKCAKKFPKMCDINSDRLISLQEWIKCFAYSGTKRDKRNKKKVKKAYADSTIPGHTPVRPPVGKGPVTKPRPCDYDRRQAIETGNRETYIPECNKKGYFKPIQCYGSNNTKSWYCFCVNAKTGDMIENTSVRYGLPNCTVSWDKCPPPRDEEIFLEALLRYFVRYMKEIMHKKESNSMDIVEGNIIEKLFNHFDVDKNDLLDGRERRKLKKSIKKKKDKAVWICGRKIHKVCDINEDGFISRQELHYCVSPPRHNKATTNTFTKGPIGDFDRMDGKKNPFIEIIKSE